MPIAPLSAEWAENPTKLLALCVWREARGEPAEAKLGVVWTIKNRCLLAPAQGFKHDIVGNVLHPWAFSSFMQGDPNSTKFPSQFDASWIDSLVAAESSFPDPVNGAVFYYSLPLTEPPRAWGAVQHCATLGGLHFYKPESV